MITNHNSTNPRNSADLALFRDRNLNAATFAPAQPARFSSEPEGEGLELCLRGLLIACLVVGLAICGSRLENFAGGRSTMPAASEAQTALAVSHPAVVHANEIL